MHVQYVCRSDGFFKFCFCQALKADGIEYDSSSFKVLQYNPPYTVPWYYLPTNQQSVSHSVHIQSYIQSYIQTYIHVLTENHTYCIHKHTYYTTYIHTYMLQPRLFKYTYLPTYIQTLSQGAQERGELLGLLQE